MHDPVDYDFLVDDVAATNACTVTTKPLILPKICESEVSYLFGMIFYIFLLFYFACNIIF